MSAADITVGYPVHALATYSTWTNPHDVSFVDWKASCGATGTSAGAPCSVFGLSGSARRLELCPTCWPAGHATYHAQPRQVEHIAEEKP